MLSLKSYFVRLNVLSVAAGVLYNSWPLGHWLNLPVSKSSLASGFEAIGQPYNWLFIGCDVASSLLIIVVCILLWKKFRIKEANGFLNLALAGVELFGACTIIDALIPEKCVQGLQACPDFTQDHLLLIHGFFSIMASVFLFIGLFLVWLYQRQNVLINGLLVGYLLFGAISLIEAIAPGKNGNWSQDYYITLCSFWLAVIPYAVYRSVEDPNRSPVRH